ncbi:MAG: M48 family metallopeptidase [Planctomycetota bacterium]|nr:M48 family metallopeptidase [Planctomycetota bacterium]
MRIAALALLCCLGLALTPGCRKVEGTDRTQLVLTSESYENSLGLQSYQEVLKTEKRSRDPDLNALVERVGTRIAAVAPDRGFTYEFVVLESPTANAFCLPGGKVAFYTGILKYMENEAQLAAVMGHEIAHAIARHGGERMSQQIVVQGVATGIDVALKAKGVEPTRANIAMAAFGAGAQIGVLLPFSRTHESEADELGLMYMAKAGYDPQEAVKFWQSFGQSGGGAPPEFLSTHPSGDTRVKALQKLQGKALPLYEQSPKHGVGEAIPARYRK